MAVLTEKSLEHMAHTVLHDHLQTQTPLTDAVVKVAQDCNLSPEHIRRLVETVNNNVFLHRFNAAVGNDKLAASEFETADADSAIQRLLEAARDLMHVNPGDSPCGSPDVASFCGADPATQELPVTRPDAQAPLPPEAPSNALSEPKISGTVVIMRLRKTAEQLAEQRLQHRYAFQEATEKLATHFTKLNTPFEPFEKDAFYKWGAQAVPFLQTLRIILKKPQATYDTATFHKVGRLIDSHKPEMQLFSRMMGHYKDLTLAEQGWHKTQNYLEQLR